jgi:hypothetical protein
MKIRLKVDFGVFSLLTRVIVRPSKNEHSTMEERMINDTREWVVRVVITPRGSVQTPASVFILSEQHIRRKPQGLEVRTTIQTRRGHDPQRVHVRTSVKTQIQ